LRNTSTIKLNRIGLRSRPQSELKLPKSKDSLLDFLLNNSSFRVTYLTIGDSLSMIKLYEEFVSVLGKP